MNFFDGFVLRTVLKGLLPSEIKAKFSDSEDFNYLLLFVRRAINSSVLYVKGPEIFLRIFLFLVILTLRLLELITLKLLPAESVVKSLSKIHPLIDDGIRLYVLLAMFAAFEDDAMRISHGFLTYKDLSKSFNS